MNIGIDARILERKMTGVGRYVFNLVKNISSCDAVNEYSIFSYSSLENIVAPNVKSVPTLGFSPRGFIQKLISPLWTNFILPLFLMNRKIDIFFSPNHTLPFLKTKTKNVAVILDLFNIAGKGFHSILYRLYVGLTLPNSVRRSDVIITISEASKMDIVRFLRVPESKIKVIYLAADERFQPRELNDERKQDLIRKYSLPRYFILYIGVIEKRKNIAGILKVADELLKRGVEMPIVLIGRLGHGGNEYIKSLKAHKNVIYRGFVEDVDLPYVYNMSSAFFFPSLYEGFGLPPLEAMQSGIAVVASNTSSLPEVVGEGGIMLPPDDYSGFADILEKIIKDADLRSAIIQRGIMQASKFSFKKMACESVDVFNTINNHG